MDIVLLLQRCTLFHPPFLLRINELGDCVTFNALFIHQNSQIIRNARDLRWTFVSSTSKIFTLNQYNFAKYILERLISNLKLELISKTNQRLVSNYLLDYSAYIWWFGTVDPDRSTVGTNCVVHDLNWWWLDKNVYF